MSEHSTVENRVLKHYVEFSFIPYGGSFEHISCDIREIPDRSEEISIPEGAICYRFFDKTYTYKSNLITVEIKHDISPRKFYGVAYTLDEVQSQFPGEARIAIYMIHNNCKRAVRTYNGHWIPLNDEDIVV